MRNRKFIPEKPVSLWQKCVGYLNIALLVGQLGLPTLAQAFTTFDANQAAVELNADPAFTKVSNSTSQFVKSDYVVESVQARSAQTIETFHAKLVRYKKSGLNPPSRVPIDKGLIKVILKHYKLPKRVGDRFVQSRMVRTQIYNQLNRTLISGSYTNETQQINDLYNNAFEFAGSTATKFGDKVTESNLKSFNKNFIWPELQTINGEQVLVPVVHLTQSTIAKQRVDGHVAEFGGSSAAFRTIIIKSGTLKTQRDTFLSTAKDLTVMPKAEIRADGDLNLFVGGTLQNLSGRLSATQNVDIVAGQYVQKTVLHRYNTAYGQGTRLGQIASVDGQNIRIHSYGDLIVQGGEITGNTIGLRADGNIRLISQQTSYSSKKEYKGFKETASEVEHLTTKLSAKDSIFLMASGAIELKAAELHADEGVIQILAGQGIFIGNEFNQIEKTTDGKWGKTTEQEQEFQTIAIRSALEAGKGVIIASEYGDVTLQATKIKSGEGAAITARNGKVNLLLAKEQKQYFYNKIKKSTWKIKTETKQDDVERAVYNQIIGGIKVNATHGITLQLGKYEGEDVSAIISGFAGSPTLGWMKQLHKDNNSYINGNLDIVTTELKKLHIEEKTSTLSPAAMAIIAIAVSVAMGPTGMEWLGTEGAIAAAFESAAMGSAMSAAAVTLATQAATSLASGNSIGDTLETMTSSDSLKSLAIAMATAGVISSFGELELFGKVDPNAQFLSSDTLVSIGNQATEAIVTATVRASISAAINGGNFDGFKQDLIDNLKTHAISSLGEGMAKEIGDLVENGQINQAVRYLSHAALGCAIGAATAEVSDSTNSGIACASGAGGAVIGEVIADSFNSQQDYDGKKAALDKELEALGLDINNFDNLTPSEKLKLVNSTSVVEQFEALKRIKAQGVDLAKLGAGLSAFIAGGEVNIAADAGENAAQNNAFWFVLQIGYGLYKAYELYQTVESIAELGVELKNAKDDAERNQILLRAATNLGVEIVVGKTASATFGVLIKKARDSGLLPDDALDEAAAIYNRMTEGNLKDYKPGQGQGRKTNPGPEVDNDRHNFPENYEKLPDGTFKGPGGGIFTDSGYTSENGYPIFQRTSGGYFYIGGDGKQVSVRSPREYGDFHKVDDVWAPGVKPIQRGRQIQHSVFENEYKTHGWGNTDEYKIWSDKVGDYVDSKGQNFPLIDFHRGDEVVSLKSINTNGSGWEQRTAAHIDDLSKRGIIGSSGNPIPNANRTLDIRVQPGGYRDAQKLIQIGRDKGIKVIIKEFSGQ
ncbi:DUF637 domain-containing protein [Pseudoalteromonas rubra]|uniref:DUF637 domain-containing protein n=1 Tax=Pseudoalteromonas rubra TaxID=43658 RepID=UPI000F774C98|nr:DUF637 domain-containing protein [Pseudoalteromonas rubra]